MWGVEWCKQIYNCWRNNIRMNPRAQDIRRCHRHRLNLIALRTREFCRRYAYVFKATEPQIIWTAFLFRCQRIMCVALSQTMSEGGMYQQLVARTGASCRAHGNSVCATTAEIFACDWLGQSEGLSHLSWCVWSTAVRVSGRVVFATITVFKCRSLPAVCLLK